MRYRSPSVFSLGGWAPLLPAGFLVSCGTLVPALVLLFAYVAVTLFGWAFLPYSASITYDKCRPSTPMSMLFGLGSFLFARRYSGNRCFFLFLRVLRCFSSPGALFPFYRFKWKWREFIPPGFPIRRSADRSLLAAPRSFSQLVASFVGKWCLGIHPVLLVA